MSVIIYLAVVVLMFASMWVIFEKADLAGWKAIIPIYNTYFLCKITWGNGWIFLAFIVPLVNIVVAIMTMYKLAKVFGKGVGFCIGLIFLSVVFYPLLAFSDSQYMGPDKKIA